MIKIALYRSAAGTDLDKVINRASGGGGYSHAELVFSDGISFSSTARHDDGSCRYADGRPKPDGTRFKPIFYEKHPERWHLIDVGACVDAERRMREFAGGELDCRYDFAGCVHFVFPFWRQHPDEWFCSEVVMGCLQAAGLWTGYPAWEVSPNRLAKLLGVLPA